MDRNIITSGDSDAFMRTERSLILRATAAQCIEDSKHYFPEAAKSLAHHVLALCGETGELANLVKKIERGDHTVEQDFARLEDEVADVFIYLMCITGLLGIDLGRAYDIKRTYNNGRFIKE